MIRRFYAGFTKMSNGISLRPLVFCGPSGSGKSTLVNRMMDEYPHIFGFSISHTTRAPRSGEIDGQHYHFITIEEMRNDITSGEFLENAVFCGNLYGTSKRAVAAVQKEGRICVLDIDVQGVKQIKKTDLHPWYVFVKPPSLDVLRTRLTERQTESEESLQRRLDTAKEELEYGTENNFDLVVINDELDQAYARLKAFLQNNVFEL